MNGDNYYVLSIPFSPSDVCGLCCPDNHVRLAPGQGEGVRAVYPVWAVGGQQLSVAGSDER